MTIAEGLKAEAEDAPLEDCTHVDGKGASTIKAMGEGFDGYWSCTRCGHPFISGLVIPAADELLQAVGQFGRGRATAESVRLAADRLGARLPGARVAEEYV